jgi:Basic region leucine zipper
MARCLLRVPFHISRERNRMHAKMTRDRKKSFISTIEQTIEELESTNRRMRAVLAEVIQTHFKSNNGLPGVTPGTSPALAPQANLLQVPFLPRGIPQVESSHSFHPAKRVRHGFSLVI